jgi:hypothetical protein
VKCRHPPHLNKIAFSKNYKHNNGPKVLQVGKLTQGILQDLSLERDILNKKMGRDQCCKPQGPVYIDRKLNNAI